MIIQFAIYNDNKRNSDKETDCYSINVQPYESINQRKQVRHYFYGAWLFNALFSDDTGNLQICIMGRLELNKMYVRSSPGHVHPNLNVLVQHKLARRSKLRIFNDDYIVDFNIRM
jgi:hypothetical protein